MPRGKASELLVRLSLEAGELVRTDRLIDDLWAPRAVNTRRNTLQSKVTMLRRALGDPPVITSRGGGYTLEIEPFEVDALAVMGNAAAASRLLDAGDDRGAADLCASTLEFYRGEVLRNSGSYSEQRAASTIDGYRRTLRAALSAAVRRELISYNPADGRMDAIPAPSDRDDGEDDLPIWEPDQTARLLGHVAEDRLSALYELAAYAGLRRAELCGLRWPDLDLD